MAMDYSGINYDYNDNVYLISNMRPAPPAAPTGLVATGSGAGIALSWSPVSAPLLVGYNIYRSTSASGTFILINTGPVAGTSYNDTTATPGGTFYYKITAADSWNGESGFSASVSATRPKDVTPPAQPSNLAASTSGSGITLTWSPNTESDLAGYNVYRSSSATGTFFKLNSSPFTSANFTDTNAASGQTSYYQVTAIDTSNNESTAATISATRTVDTTPPATPSGFTASGSTSNITLTWTPNTEPDLAGYNIYRSASGTGTFVKLNSTPLTMASYTDTTAPAGVFSYYRLTAVDISGNESSFTTANALRKDTVAPSAPASVAASGDASGITVTWSPNTEKDLAGYNIYSSSSAMGTFTKLNVTGLLTAASYFDSAAPSSSTTFYRVTAVDLSGNESAPTGASAFRPGSNITPPAQPQNFQALANTTSIALTWSANTETDLAGYNLYRSSSPSGTFVKLNTAGLLTSTSYNDTTAAAGQTWYYQLTAVDTSSNESSAATANATIPAQTTSFTSADIGNPTPAGVTTVVTEGSDYDVQAGGANINGTADQFRFVYKQITGDFDVKVLIGALQNAGGTTSSWAKAGLMARTDLSAGSANVYSYDTPGPNGFSSSYRSAAAANTTVNAGPANGGSKWIRLTRVGNTFTTYASTDGINWTPMGSAITLNLGSTLYVGMATTSHETNALITAKFRSFTQS